MSFAPLWFYFADVGEYVHFVIFLAVNHSGLSPNTDANTGNDLNMLKNRSWLQLYGEL